MDKKALLQKKSELENEIMQINKELSDYDLKRLSEQYGEKFSCEFCRYNAVLGFSGDGWHNMCGANSCTCCHSCCEKYMPDTKATLKIKQSGDQDALLRSKNTNGYSHISYEEQDSLYELGANIFAEEPSEYTMKMLDLFLGSRE